MMSPITFGMIGCGDIGSTRHAPTVDAHPEARLLALCDIDIARAEQLALSYPVAQVTGDYRQLLANPSIDAVILAVSPWVTPRIAIEALRAGKQVLCEKPMALDIKTAKQVRQAESETGRGVQIGFTYRHGSLIDTLKNWIDTDQLGRPLYYRLGVFDEIWDPQDNPVHYERIMEALRHGSPSIHDGAHVADWLHYLTGSTVVGLQAAGLRSRDEFAATNCDVAFLRFKNGDVARIEIGWFYPVFPRGEFEILGPKGVAVFDRINRNVRLHTKDNTEVADASGDYVASCFRIQLDKFIRSIQSGKPFVPGTKEGLASLQLTLRMARAVKTSGKG